MSAGRIRPMNILDAGLLAMESPSSPMHISGLQILRPPARAGKDYLAKLVAHLRSIQPSAAPFNFRLAPHEGRFGIMPAWQEVEHADMTQHVQHHALPWPGGDDELMTLVARLNSGLLDRARPMWEQHVIEGLAGGRFALFTRVHHALIDGEWGMRLMRKTTSASARERSLPPYWAMRFEPAPPDGGPSEAEHRNWWQRKTEQGSELIRSGEQLWQAFGRVVESFRHPSDDGLPPLYSAPECMLNGPLTPRRAIGVVQLDLPRIAALAHAHEATVNEVVLALCSASLRAYLKRRKALPDKPLIANMPVALPRRAQDTAGNAVGSAFVSLATHIADPLRRFEAIRGSSRHAKQLLRDLSPVALTLFGATTGLPFILAQTFGRAEQVRAQTLLVSNVPGPREPRYVNGAAIEAQYPISLLVPGQAMNITVVGRAGHLDVAVVACPDLAPRPDEVAAGLAQALDELERAYGRRRGKPRATPRETPVRGSSAARTKSAR